MNKYTKKEREREKRPPEDVVNTPLNVFEGVKAHHLLLEIKAHLICGREKRKPSTKTEKGRSNGKKYLKKEGDIQ